MDKSVRVQPSSTSPSSPHSDTTNERTEVYYGNENVLNAELRFFASSKEKIDSCMNYTRPQLAIEIEQIKKAFIDTKRSRRGVKFRYLTEITSENISFCKELISIVDELRYIEGIKANFMISESEYLAPMILYRKGETSTKIIYSNIREVIEHQQYIFDSFWSKAIPAEHPILVLIYLEPCFEFIDHLTFFFNAYSGRKSESEVIAECLIQYGFHFLVLRRYSSLSFSSLSVIEPLSIRRFIL